jgi:hypothetical protein
MAGHESPRTTKLYDRTKDSPILDALFPAVRQQVLAATLLEPEKWWYMTELALRLGTSPQALLAHVRYRCTRPADKSWMTCELSLSETSPMQRSPACLQIADSQPRTMLHSRPPKWSSRVGGYRVASTPGHHRLHFEAARIALGSSTDRFLDYFETSRRKPLTGSYVNPLPFSAPLHSFSSLTPRQS